MDSNTFIASLINDLASLHPPPAVIAQLPASQSYAALLSRTTPEDQDKIQNLLATLHFILPQEFIPALDLLDRGLVSRVVVKSDDGPNTLSPSATKSSGVDQAVGEAAYENDLPKVQDERLNGAESTEAIEDNAEEGVVIRRAGDNEQPNPSQDSPNPIENEIFLISSAPPPSVALPAHPPSASPVPLSSPPLPFSFSNPPSPPPLLEMHLPSLHPLILQSPPSLSTITFTLPLSLQPNLLSILLSTLFSTPITNPLSHPSSTTTSDPKHQPQRHATPPTNPPPLRPRPKHIIRRNPNATGFGGSGAVV